jgi:hypothetical protein
MPGVALGLQKSPDERLNIKRVYGPVAIDVGGAMIASWVGQSVAAGVG